MKRISKALLCIVLLLSISACNLQNSQIVSDNETTTSISETTEVPETTTTISDDEIIEEQSEIIKIGFSNIKYKKAIEKTLTLDELDKWENPYSKYSSYILYSTLTEDEKIVYRALEYALVHSYEYTCIDSRIEVSRTRMEEIANLLAKDTPLLEQNINAVAFIYTAFYTYQYSETRYVDVLLRSNTVSVKNFKLQHWNNKMLAIKMAEKIVNSMKETSSEAALAEEIYRYVTENVKYTPYENEYGHYEGSKTPFLYDALIKKESHCDGYTNALALLYAIAGFEQVEKDNRTTIGHTWNCVKIDGKWYNIDSTVDPSWVPEESKTMGGGLYFCFSDKLQEDYPDNAELFPKCEESLYINEDATLKDCNTAKFYNAAYDGLIKHNKEWALIIVDKYDKDAAEDYYYTLAYTLNLDFSVGTKSLPKGKTAVFIFKTELL